MFIENKKIFLHFNGEVPSALEAGYKSDVKNYENIKDFEVKVFGNKNRSVDKISDALDRAYRDLDQKDLIIQGMQEQIADLKQQTKFLEERLKSKASQENESFIAFSTVSKDAKIKYADLRQFGFAKMLNSKDFIQVDTIPVAAVKWNPALSDSVQTLREAELKVWLQKELSLDTLIIERIK